MRSRVALAVLGMVTFGAVTVLGDSRKPNLKSIGEALTCQCGCNQTVNGCNHFECSSRTEMQGQVEKEIAAGKRETTILQDFVLRYGVKVLATPPARGFNLTVWILPLVGLVAGLAFVVGVARRWRKPEGEPPERSRASLDPKVLAAVEDEMKASGFEG